jgi:micrococcal nuclease
MPLVLRFLLPLLLLLLVVPGALRAESFTGVVSHVTDGDSLWVRPATGGAPVELRLLHLDAPEGCQRGGAAARAALRARVLHQPVTVHARSHDDYGRTLARVEHRGADVGGWLVGQGHAWAVGFRRSPGPYAALQAQARRQGRGLWADGRRPQPPRSFRKQHGRCQPGEQGL